MTRSIFSTPLITPALRWLANAGLWLRGWRVMPVETPQPPFIFIGAPHTSNWDFLLLMAAVFHLRMEIRWLGKHTLFPPLLGGVMRWMGGIEVNRGGSHNLVARLVELIQQHPDTILCIPPEGTRSAVKQWKTGFYRIASGANVPILMAAIDAGNRQLRVLGEFRPSGNIDQDMLDIQARYRGIAGLRPENSWAHEDSAPDSDL